ncbi:SAM-dependent methyltransferase [Chromobacterium sp. ATCC 53434]|uniref:class I SAM-dependent methyltransferase n=1 Tax=Chromobacterium sp. (strain ATCC 53434 / SC 14030) TaxID=2059672 RepID=UPI000C790729|nr:class I SAM-dependent methyltransferase [Chromobacterium sp. ATCC 53434]AUH51927.1 SAM-dependent methyltransferase [Chromobacterium sp. ATCC 53434]
MPDAVQDDIFHYNQAAWDRQAAADCEWSRPVDADAVAEARLGRVLARLTPGPLPAGWLDDARGLDILCLAGGGGQQAPLLAAAGARVTVLDASSEQLARDREVAERENLTLRLERGDMRDLSRFADASFDCVFHPISNLYVPDVAPVWRECCRALRPGGRLLASFYNPALFVADRDPALLEQGLIRPRFPIPYSDLEHLPAEALAAKRERGEALVFGHSLAALVGGQAAAGLLIAGFHEDWQPRPRFLIERHLPAFIATLAVKPA